MARVRVRDQYAAEHWIDEGQLVFEPWRSYEVLGREDDQPAEIKPAETGTPKPSSKAASRPAPKVEE